MTQYPPPNSTDAARPRRSDRVHRRTPVSTDDEQASEPPRATTQPKRPENETYARKNLLAEQRTRMLVECGGRCALCNRYLLEGRLSFCEVTFGELAHIIGLQPNERSPRGLDEDLSEDERNDPANLMLVCEGDHSEIDKSGSREMFPTDWLRQRKADHNARIHFVTGLNPQHPTVPLRVIARVRNDVVEVDRDAVANAVMVSAMRYPKFRLSDRNAIEIDLRGLPGEGDASGAYYNAARARIDEVFDHTLAAGWAAEDIRHLSVFAFARIPILVYLGTKLGDHTPVDIYQRDRVHQDWTWPTRDGHLAFTVDAPIVDSSPREAVQPAPQGGGRAATARAGSARPKGTRLPRDGARSSRLRPRSSPAAEAQRERRLQHAGGVRRDRRWNRPRRRARDEDPRRLGPLGVRRSCTRSGGRRAPPRLVLGAPGPFRGTEAN